MPSGKKERRLKKKYSSFFSNRRDIPEPEPCGLEYATEVKLVIEVPLQDREGNPRE